MQELHRVLHMPQYGWICQNRKWICLNMSGFLAIDRILNMSHTIHSSRSLYKSMSTYWEMSVFRTLSKIEGFWKNIRVLTIFVKHSILYLWESSEYVSQFKYIRVLNIPGLSICRGSEFPGLHSVCLFSDIWQGSEQMSGWNYEKLGSE